jgi:pimeloyl-ACP methyl ester carboxylesterase
MPFASSGPTSQVYFSQRLRLHYVDWGNHDAPPLLLVHGGRDHCRNWDWVAQTLRKDFHVIAPDLRGHGDSAWAIGGNYLITDYVYDIAQLVRQRTMAPLSIMGHSMGGFISTLYAGLYPKMVSKMVIVDGIVFPPEQITARTSVPSDQRLDNWITQTRQLAARMAKKYKSIDEAVARMHGENPRLSREQALSLTLHGVNQNEDGTYSWKFDNYVRAVPPVLLSTQDVITLWRRITCPMLLVNGSESFIPDPAKNGAVDYFSNVKSITLEGAGHWVHHDKLDAFLALAEPFLKT